MDQELTPKNGDGEIRRLLQEEVLARIPLLLKYSSAAGLRLQVPETDIQIIAGPESWIASQTRDAATNGCAQREDKDGAHLPRYRTDYGDPGVMHPDAGGEWVRFADIAARQSQAAHPSDERALFEAWAVSDDGGWMPHALWRNPEGHEFDYKDDDVQAEWRAWQARAHLAGQSQATKVQAVPPIGRLLDEFSALPVLWGLNEPGALIRHSDVFKMLVAAGKTYLAPTAQEVTKPAVPDLHNAIMNLPAMHAEDFYSTTALAYKIGHRDARHAAAELAIGAEAAQEVTQPSKFGSVAMQELIVAHAVAQEVPQQAAKAETAEQADGTQANVLPPTRGTGSQHDAGAAVLSALRDGIPLQEPVYITKAVLAQREARVSLSGGTGPVACAMLVNIQLTPWAEGPEKAEAFASGYNTAMKWYRAALLELAEKASADAASRCRAQGGGTSEENGSDLAPTTSTVSASDGVDEKGGSK